MSAALATILVFGPANAVAADLSLAWDPSLDTVAGYQVYWGTRSGVYTNSVNAGRQTTWTVRGLSRGVRYYFVIKAYSPLGVESGGSNEVSTILGDGPRAAFTDDPLVPGVHSMRLVHLTELRTRIDALRVASRLPAVQWLPVASQSTPISASHLTQLRAAIAPVYAALGLAAPTYANDPLASGTPLKALHIAQLRDAVKAVEP